MNSKSKQLWLVWLASSGYWIISMNMSMSLLMRVKEDSDKAGLKLNIQKTNIMTAGPIISWRIKEEKWKQWQILFSWALKPLDGDCSHEIKRHMLPGRKTMYDKPRQCTKKQRHHFANKGLYSQSYSFSSSHVQMWEFDHKKRMSA